jgi:hypothetical protein
VVSFSSDSVKTALEAHEMLRTAFSDSAIGSTQTSGRFSLFKHRKTLVEDDEHSGHSSSGCTDRNIEEFCKIVSEDTQSIILQITGWWGLLYKTCQ